MKNKAWILISLLIPIFTVNVQVDQSLVIVDAFPNIIEREFIHSVNLSEVKETYSIHMTYMDVTTEFLDFGAGMPNGEISKNTIVASKQLELRELNFLAYKRQKISIDDQDIEWETQGQPINIRMQFEPLITYILKKVSLYD